MPGSFRSLDERLRLSGEFIARVASGDTSRQGRDRPVRTGMAYLTGSEITKPWRKIVTCWKLYSERIHRHEIVGMDGFSRTAFGAQLAVPGLVPCRAIDDRDDTVGIVLSYLQGSVRYYHLAVHPPRRSERSGHRARHS